MSKKKKLTPEELADQNEAQMFTAKVWSTETRLALEMQREHKAKKNIQLMQERIGELKNEKDEAREELFSVS